MKANDLRIGNYVEHNGNWSYRNHSAPKQIQWEDRDFYALGECTISLDDIKPIPLTEEWLLKFGFKKLCSKSDNGYKSSAYSFSGKYSFIVCFDDGSLSVNFWQGNEKKYVHQLQNLYFALTGEELRIIS